MYRKSTSSTRNTLELQSSLPPRGRQWPRRCASLASLSCARSGHSGCRRGERPRFRSQRSSVPWRCKGRRHGPDSSHAVAACVAGVSPCGSSSRSCRVPCPGVARSGGRTRRTTLGSRRRLVRQRCGNCRSSHRPRRSFWKRWATGRDQGLRRVATPSRARKDVCDSWIAFPWLTAGGFEVKAGAHENPRCHAVLTFHPACTWKAPKGTLNGV